MRRKYSASTRAPPEVIDGAAYLVDPLSVEEIAAGMRTILPDSTLRAAMAAKGIARARDSWERCAQQLLTALRESPLTVRRT
jgi:glycosyltransferase involved in cell wall biosynthesis